MDKTQLEKGLAALKAAAEDGNVSARRAELFQKAQTGDINTEEHEELLKSLGGNGALKDEVTSAFAASDTIVKSTDVSDVLRDYVGATVMGLEKVADQLSKSENQDQGFRVALADSLIAQGEILKSMIDEVTDLKKSLATWGEAPARGPKSQLAGQPEAEAALAKSMAGGAGGDSLGREEILDAMTDMVQKGIVDAAGEPLVEACSKYESTASISPAMLAAVTSFTREQRQAG